MDVDNIQWTHQTLFDHFSDGATINVLFPGRLDPLRAEFLALMLLKLMRLFCIRNRLSTALKSSNRTCVTMDRTKAW